MTDHETPREKEVVPSVESTNWASRGPVREVGMVRCRQEPDGPEYGVRNNVFHMFLEKRYKISMLLDFGVCVSGHDESVQNTDLAFGRVPID